MNKNSRFRNFILVSFVIIFFVAAGQMTGCGTAKKPTERTSYSKSERESSEHSGNENSEKSSDGEEGRYSEEDEGESGDIATKIVPLYQRVDEVVNGVRIQMEYDSNAKAFKGTVKNVVSYTLQNILIEINLKNNTRTVLELGPLPIGNLKKNKVKDVILRVDDEPNSKNVVFNSYQVHPEVQNGPDRNSSEEGDQMESSGLSLQDTFSQDKYGIHLELCYDFYKKLFFGSMINTTNKTLQNVRVEVHTSNGVELGPYKYQMKSGETVQLQIDASSIGDFSKWTAHVEAGNTSEHGNSNTKNFEWVASSQKAIFKF